MPLQQTNNIIMNVICDSHSKDLYVECVYNVGFGLEHTEQKSNCLMLYFEICLFQEILYQITGIAALFLSFPLSLLGKISTNRLCNFRMRCCDTDNYINAIMLE